MKILNRFITSYLLLIILPWFANAKINDDALNQLVKHVKEKPQALTLVKSLTTEVGPRIAGSPGDKMAVKWAENKFKTLGFDKIYKEPVRVRNWSRGIASATVIAPYKQKLVVTALGGTIATPKDGLTAQVVQFDSLESLIKADKAEVENKIVFINKKMRRHKQGKGYRPVVIARSKGAIEAAKLGAKAIVIRSVGTSNTRFAHTGAMKYDATVEKIPAGALSNPDADLLASMFENNSPVTINLQLDAKEHGWQTSYNVIGEITGTEQPENYILLAAHLDSWDEGTGALDDGAGVGVVMAAAANIKNITGQPKRTIRVVLYANEEFGLVGAKGFVKKHKASFDKIIVAAESDFGAGPIWQFSTNFGNNFEQGKALLAKYFAPYNIAHGNNKAYGGPDISMLPKYGVPVVSLSQDGTNYFDYHHTPNDTFDKIVPAELNQNELIWTIFGYITANSDISFR
ncbi:M28 family peptidase [Flocculibacter collagenilyticus]|uniref:M28 family peptidase n=1 Tax=Flocculibacter collagenilyticus TaxID=2744479 RepID=UPI0018F5A1CC|nr:M28 family peptidase [Flocculibacter collagenilyticus]